MPLSLVAVLRTTPVSWLVAVIVAGTAAPLGSMMSPTIVPDEDCANEEDGRRIAANANNIVNTVRAGTSTVMNFMCVGTPPVRGRIPHLHTAAPSLNCSGAL